LKGATGDLTATYIPLEKIEKIKLKGPTMEIQVRPSITIRYVAVIRGEREQMKELAKDIVARRGLKKKLLKKEWVEVPS